MARNQTLIAALLCLGVAAFAQPLQAEDAADQPPAPPAEQPVATPAPQPPPAPAPPAPADAPTANPALQADDIPAAPAEPAAEAAPTNNAPVQRAAAPAGAMALPRAGLAGDAASTGRPEVEVESVRPSANTPSDEAELRIRGIRTNEYFYQSYGRPDLCRALVTGKFEPVGNPDIVDVNSAKLVGIMWGASERFALLEDGFGNGFILHAGDRVRNGRIEAVNETSVVASITLYGITSRVILRLEPQREGKKR